MSRLALKVAKDLGTIPTRWAHFFHLLEGSTCRLFKSGTGVDKLICQAVLGSQKSSFLSDVDASKVDLLVNLVTLGSKPKPQTTFCCCAGLVEPCIGLEECRRLAETLAIDHQELDLFLGRTAEPIFLGKGWVGS